MSQQTPRERVDRYYQRHLSPELPPRTEAQTVLLEDILLAKRKQAEPDPQEFFLPPLVTEEGEHELGSFWHFSC